MRELDLSCAYVKTDLRVQGSTSSGSPPFRSVVVAVRRAYLRLQLKQSFLGATQGLRIGAPPEKGVGSFQILP